MNSLLDWFTPTRWIILGLVLLALISAGWRIHHGIWQSGYDAREKIARDAELRAMKENDRIQVGLQVAADKLKGESDATNRAINDRLADALGSVSMLKRAARRGSGVPAPAGTCAGATGAELSGPDAGFLVREAARADSLRAALDTCQRQYNAVRLAQPQAAPMVKPPP